jgi:hypothetical protein
VMRTAIFSPSILKPGPYTRDDGEMRRILTTGSRWRSETSIPAGRSSSGWSWPGYTSNPLTLRMLSWMQAGARASQEDPTSLHRGVGPDPAWLVHIGLGHPDEAFRCLSEAGERLTRERILMD